MPEVSCKAVAVQNSSQWPCSMCPIPQLRLVGVRTSYIFFSNISWTPWVLDPITNPYLGPHSWLHLVTWRGVGEWLLKWGEIGEPLGNAKKSKPILQLVKTKKQKPKTRNKYIALIKSSKRIKELKVTKNEALIK